MRRWFTSPRLRAEVAALFARRVRGDRPINSLQLRGEAPSPRPSPRARGEGAHTATLEAAQMSLLPQSDLPDRPFCCPAPVAKIFRFALTPNQLYIPRRPAP